MKKSGRRLPSAGIMKFLDRRIQRERMDKGVTTSTAGELFGTNDFRSRGTLGSGTLSTGTFLTEKPLGNRSWTSAILASRAARGSVPSVATIMKKLAGGSRLSES